MVTSPRPAQAPGDVPLLYSPVWMDLRRVPRHCPHAQKGCNPQSLSTAIFQEQRWIRCLHSPTSSFRFHADVLMSTCLPQSQLHGCSWRRQEDHYWRCPSSGQHCLWVTKCLMLSLQIVFMQSNNYRAAECPRSQHSEQHSASLPLLTSSPSGWRQFTAGQMASSSSESSCSENDTSEGSKWLSLERCISKRRSRSLSSLLVQRSFEWFSFSFFFLGVLIFFTLALFSSQKLSLSKRRFSFLSM